MLKLRVNPIAQNDLIDIKTYLAEELNNPVAADNVLRKKLFYFVHNYSSIIDEKLRKHLKKTNDSWRMDGTYIKIKEDVLWLKKINSMSYLHRY